MNRLLTPALLVACLVFPSCNGDDPDRTIQGGGVIAPGFKVRFDNPKSKIESVRLVQTETGFKAENGPNTIFWRPEDRAGGRYSLSVEVQHLNSHGHSHGAGLVFGGSKLAEAEQAYTYFLVRGDGRFLIKNRDGKETRPITAWEAHKAVHSEDSKGVAKNKIAVSVGEKETRFLVNGVEVHRVENKKIHTDGLFGFRIVHNLEIHFVGLRCEPSS